ncbi:ABC transporter substrate-binding protein [Paenibacillus bouchesdurhonensis]|uniref:ABC transporter substrate-binding protein n=1 Tax=Paenibacillus bouchesdurhonensis TaxID=1870990 RepID=UPI001902110D|nr:ABC transporter substrate-binding protein [Paenibacillus bouchesdurhonensis]
MRKYYLLFLLLVVTLSACTAGSKEEPADMTLKVLAFNKNIFNQNYGNLFLATHPTYKVEVISIVDSLVTGTFKDISEVIEELIVEENPDVIVIPMDSYIILRDNEKLTSLTTLIQKDHVDLSGFTPSVVDFFKDEQGQIYGLTPTFVGQALYYNKSLFDRYGVSYPRDYITWEEMFNLAGQFPKSNEHSEPVYGLYHKDASNAFMMALGIGESIGLSMYNNEQFTLSTDSWETIFKDITDCFKSEACYDPNKIESNESVQIEDMERASYPFINGNIAMAIDESSLYRFLINKDKGSLDVDWGIVSLPVSADNPDMGNGVYMNDIFSIPQTAGNKEGAWELIKYVTGDNYFMILPQINMADLPTRPNPNMDDNMSAFYKMKKTNITLINQLRKFPLPFLNKMDEIIPRYMGEMMSDQQTVSNSLKSMNEELELELKKIEESKEQ